ncbi:hypothetical protein B0T18DRAFT_254267 [Schizothecium vesticola]|uniref:Uncharacterized protein n=1 Tax=Schizothecium vesticola TaxID=314040 RepID=A0AA40EEU0_9PEZI|nr:hypothetical protein B0T18DRAFT_254267 [Schizothecium vesticola]
MSGLGFMALALAGRIWRAFMIRQNSKFFHTGLSLSNGQKPLFQCLHCNKDPPKQTQFSLSSGSSPDPCLSVASLAVPHPKPASSKLCCPSFHWQMITGGSCSRHGNIMPTRASTQRQNTNPAHHSKKTLEPARKTLTWPHTTSRDMPSRHDRPKGHGRVCGNHTGELVQPPHLPAGVDETDTANVVHLLRLLVMHARHQILKLERPRTIGRYAQSTISVVGSVALSRAFCHNTMISGLDIVRLFWIGGWLDDWQR